MITKTQPADIFQTSGDGLDFDAVNETWIIDPGVIVFTPSDLAAGVSSHSFANSTLINDGKVYATGFLAAGANLNVGNTSVVNAAGAEILGSGFGVIMNGSGTNVVNNLGDILSVSAAISIGLDFGSATHGVFLNNHGYVFGSFIGVSISSNFVGGKINNFHTIRSDGDAIEISTAPNLLTNITNAAGGVIKGAADAIHMFAGMLHFVNHGTVIGNIVDAANVSIFVGGGSDRITAGPGHDRFIFNAALTGQIEKITHFKHGVDKIVLSEADFANIGAIGLPLAAADFHVGAHATTSSQHIIYNAKNGFLYYDPDGNGAMPQIHFATVSPHLPFTHGDLLVAA